MSFTKRGGGWGAASAEIYETKGVMISGSARPGKNIKTKVLVVETRCAATRKECTAESFRQKRQGARAGKETGDEREAGNLENNYTLIIWFVKGRS